MRKSKRYRRLREQEYETVASSLSLNQSGTSQLRLRG